MKRALFILGIIAALLGSLALLPSSRAAFHGTVSWPSSETISFSPSTPSLADNATSGTAVTTASVSPAISPAYYFGYGSPNFSGPTGLCAPAPSGAITLGRNLSSGDDGIQHCTVTVAPTVQRVSGSFCGTTTGAANGTATCSLNVASTSDAFTVGITSCNNGCASAITPLSAAVTIGGNACTAITGANNLGNATALTLIGMYKCTPSATGSQTVQAVVSGGTASYYVNIVAQEWAGAAAASTFEGGNVGYATASNPSISTSGSVAAGDLVYSFVNDLSGNAAPTPVQTAGGATGTHQSDEYQIASAAGTYTNSWTGGSDTYARTIVAIKPSSTTVQASADLSITISPPTPTLSGITLSNNLFTCGTAGTVGAISVQGQGAISGATLSLTGTDAAQFGLSSTTVPSNLTVGASPQGCPRSYGLNIVATLNGAIGSPFTQAETITGASPSIASVSFYTSSCGSGSAITVGNPISVADNSTSGTAVAVVCVTMADQSTFDGTLAITSQSASGLMQLSGSAVQVASVNSGEDGSQTIAVTATPGAGETGSSVAGTLYITVGPADPTVGVLPSYNDASANWKMAGLASIGGIPNRTTVCATLSTLGASTDNAAQINSAIQSCPPGQVVQLNAGTFGISMNSEILLNKGVTVRGYGSTVGSCNGTSTPCWPTVLVQYNGLTYYHASETCSGGSCTNAPVFNMSPRNGNMNWSGCNNGYVTVGNCAGTYATLTADGAQGATTISVNNTSIFSVGMYVKIDEASGGAYRTDSIIGSGQVWAAADAFSTSGSPSTGRVIWEKHNPSWGSDDYGSSEYPYQNNAGLGCLYYGFNCDRPTSEIHKIISINSGNHTITFDSPLTISYRVSNAAQVYYSTSDSSATYLPFVEQASVENMSIQRADGGAVYMAWCAYCWVKNVDAAYFARGAVEMNNVFRAEVNTVFGHDCGNDTNNGNEYPFDFQGGTTESLLTNSMTRICGKSMTARAGGAGCVVSYNYFDDMEYEIDSLGNWLIDASANGSHLSGGHHILFEGNWAVNSLNDHQHGNNVYHTYFRNFLTGYRTPFTDPTNGNSTVNDFTGASSSPGNNGNFRPGAPTAYAYWHAWVGNYMGTPGHSTTGNGWVYQNSASGGEINSDIWDLGSEDNFGNYDPNLAGATPFLFRHGNYDTVTASIHWDSGTPDHNLPNSFYLTSAPSFFSAGSGYAWPWVTPTGSPQLQTGPSSCGSFGGLGFPAGSSSPVCSGLPVLARWEAGTPFVQP